MALKTFPPFFPPRKTLKCAASRTIFHFTVRFHNFIQFRRHEIVFILFFWLFGRPMKLIHNYLHFPWKMVPMTSSPSASFSSSSISDPHPLPVNHSNVGVLSQQQANLFLCAVLSHCVPFCFYPFCHLVESFMDEMFCLSSSSACCVFVWVFVCVCVFVCMCVCVCFSVFVYSDRHHLHHHLHPFRSLFLS